MEQWWLLMCLCVSSGLFLILNADVGVHFNQLLVGISSGHFLIRLPRICSVRSFHFLTPSLASVSLEDTGVGIMKEQVGKGAVLAPELPSGEEQGELTQPGML